MAVTRNLFPTLALSVLASLVWVLGPARAQSSAPQDVAAEVAVSAGAADRRATQHKNLNPDSISYELGVGLGVDARIRVASWISFSAYYLRSYHNVELPRGAARIDWVDLNMGKLFAYSIGGQVEPSWRPARRLRIWGLVGMGWGRLRLGKTQVREAARSYVIPERTGVFLEVPLGVGATYELWEDRLGVTFRSVVAPNFNQSGNLFEGAAVVDSNGQLDDVAAMPQLGVSVSHMLGVVGLF